MDGSKNRKTAMTNKKLTNGSRSNYRWVISGLIFLITLINFIDRSAISFIIDPLKQEFHFTDTEFGMILSAFGLGYFLLTILGGWLVDTLGSRLVWPLAAIGWSLCVGLSALDSSSALQKAPTSPRCPDPSAIGFLLRKEPEPFP
jgi:MFS family permease